MKRVLAVVAPLAVLAGAGYWAWRNFSPQRRRVPRLPDDALLTRRVAVSLKQGGMLPEGLRFRVLRGTVILAGTVSEKERDRILRAVLAVPGIQGVRNGLAVESGTWEESPSAP